MKKLAFILALMVSVMAFSQDRCLEELGELLDPTTELFWNPHDNVIDINGYQIPIDYVKLQYTSENTLRFIAEHPGYKDIYDSNKDKNVSEVEFKFKTKADVYQAMKIIEKIKWC